METGGSSNDYIEKFSSSESINKESIKVKQEDEVPNKALIVPVLLCLAISFGGFIFGWDVGTIGGIVNMNGFKTRFGTATNPDNGNKFFPDILVGLIVSIFNIGCAIGGVTLAKAGDVWGRKTGITLAILCYITGTAVQIINDTKWYQFLIGRIICGLSVGCTAVLVPMFIAESAPIKIRGAMVVLYQVMITFGILLGNITNYLCIHLVKESEFDWAVPVTFGLLWAFLLACGLYCTPESAPYLATKKMDIEGAKVSFAKMNGVTVYDPRTEKFIEDMSIQSFDYTQLNMSKRKWHDFLTGEPKLGLRVFIGVMLMIFQQLSGINYFFYYSTSLFETAGIKDPYAAAIVLSAVNFIATFGGIYLVEAIGRKSSLLLGSVGMFICMVIYASIGSFLLDRKGTSYGMIAVTCVYIVFFATTSGPVTFVIVSELFPIRTRAISMALCTAANWMINFQISLLTPFITSKINFLYGYVFAGCLFLSIIFIWIMVPETKGKDDVAIDKIFDDFIESDTESI